MTRFISQASLRDFCKRQWDSQNKSLTENPKITFKLKKILHNYLIRKF